MNLSDEFKRKCYIKERFYDLNCSVVEDVYIKVEKEKIGLRYIK